MLILTPVLKRLVKKGRLVVRSPGWREECFGPGGDTGPEVTVRFARSSVARRIARDPALGAAEAYMEGDLQIVGDDIEALLELVSLNARWTYDNRARGGIAETGRALNRLYQRNKPRIARRNVAHHYDLSDRLYDLFLDADRQYSCAYYRPGVEDLETAQHDKKAHIAAKLLLEEGQHVLDIGCGWGGMALYLNRVAGVQVTGVTLSEEQLAVARRRAAEADVADQVRFELIDYRQLPGRYDRIVSVGMFEHVGVPQYRTFFGKIRDLLTEDGVALIHTIGRADGPGETDSFTRKYIFPGGYAPALSEIAPAIENEYLWITDIEVLRLHYAKTLDAWLRRTKFAREEIVRLFDERFYRMWLFYLAGSRGAFENGGHMNLQIQLSRHRDAVPLTRDYMFDAERRLLQSSAEGAAGSASEAATPS
ncbi:SAM-dependent methyltransferase [Pacificimonas flava]|uniref:SAM-dependent methyltransferase n=2 Tax=Pacificimonas TaxID=1960290 RepID=A0A219B3G4_9SPHN|nr:MULTISPECIES: cyclopropane-fatty-acyl-phospholipid synthase family protein [Pacificimonas]MBZ6377421.1 class I SAM-dependent methyltransferase [Pacificimonas aurantium]OWV32877.1 SAM-dependent methyltransferase [Pacificimonas flava]